MIVDIVVAVHHLLSTGCEDRHRVGNVPRLQIGDTLFDHFLDFAGGLIFIAILPIAVLQNAAHLSGNEFSVQRLARFLWRRHPDQRLQVGFALHHFQDQFDQVFLRPVAEQISEGLQFTEAIRFVQPGEKQGCYMFTTPCLPYRTATGGDKYLPIGQSRR